MDRETLYSTDAISRFLSEGKTATEESEEEYVDRLMRSIHEINNAISFPPVKRVEREFMVIYDQYHRTYIDVAIFHEDSTATFIECKGDKRPSLLYKAIGQVLMQRMMLNDRHDVDARFVISAPNIPRKLVSVIHENSLPISVLEVNNDKVTFISHSSE